MVHLSPPLALALLPGLGVWGLKKVSHGHRGQDNWCRRGDCLSEGGRLQTAGCVQWSAAVVWLCVGSHSLSRGKDIMLTFNDVVSVVVFFCFVFVEARKYLHQ